MNTRKVLRIGIAASIFFIITSSLYLVFLKEQPVSASETSENAVTGAAGLNFYVKIVGGNQGWIKGSVTQAGREDLILCHQYSHSVYIPTDPQSGMVTGKRVHTPVTILKEVDISTPLLHQAFATNEKLLTVEIKFWRPSTTGQEVQYFTVTLEEAYIVMIQDFMPNNLNPDTYQWLMEEVSFVYRKITWTWTDGGIEYSDTWIEERV